MIKKSILPIVLFLCVCAASMPAPASTATGRLAVPSHHPPITITPSPVPTFTMAAEPATPAFQETIIREPASPSLTPSLTPLPVEAPNCYSKVTAIVRRDPDYAAPVIGRAAAGTRYPVSGNFLGWLLIDLGNGQTGWVDCSSGFYSRFEGNLERVPQISLTIPPTPTSTPICKPQRLPGPGRALEEAQQALVTYYRLLSERQYAQAVPYFSGDYDWLRYSNPDVDPQDSVHLFQHGCEINGLACLPIRRIVKAHTVSPGIYEIVVEFSNKDGSLYRFGGCCEVPQPGTEIPWITQWTYRVVLDCHGQYLVQDLPNYGG